MFVCGIPGGFFTRTKEGPAREEPFRLDAERRGSPRAGTSSGHAAGIGRAWTDLQDQDIKEGSESCHHSLAEWCVVNRSLDGGR